MSQKPINARLKALREERGLSVADVVKGTGIIYQLYGKYEKESTPRLDALIKLADFYDLSLDELVDRTGKSSLERAIIETVKAGFEVCIDSVDNTATLRPAVDLDEYIFFPVDFPCDEFIELVEAARRKTIGKQILEAYREKQARIIAALKEATINQDTEKFNMVSKKIKDKLDEFPKEYEEMVVPLKKSELPKIQI